MMRRILMAAIFMALFGSHFSASAADKAVLKEEWTHHFRTWPTWTRRETSVPAFSADHVFIGTQKGVFYALSSTKGKTHWKYKAGAPLRSKAGTGDGLVFFGDQKGQVHALTEATGKMLWKQQFESPVQAAPAFSDGVVYVQTMAEKVTALDARTGKMLWTLASPPHEQLAMLVPASPVVADHVVYAGFPGGYVAAVEALDGRVIWQKSLDTSDRPFSGTSTPILLQDQLVLPFIGQGVVALDRQKGTVSWRFDEQDAFQVAALKDRVAVGTLTGKIYALDGTNGKVLWTQQLEFNKSAVAGGLTVLESGIGPLIIFADSKDNLWGLDAETGHLLWHHHSIWSFGGYWSPPVTDHEALLSWSSHGRLSRYLRKK